MELRLDGAAAGTVVATAGGTWSIAVDVADGAHAILTRATDAAHNVSRDSSTVSFTLDGTPPAEPAISAPAQAAILAARDLVAGKLVFAGTAEPGATVGVQLDGASAGTAVAAPGTGAWSVTATVADGAHRVRAEATDAAGNPSGLCPVVAFTLDSVPPGVPVVLAPYDGETLFPLDLLAGRVVVSGTAEVNALVELEVDGAAAGSGTAIGGSWSVSVLVESGAHTLRASAIDGAGNASGPSASVAFTLDSTRLAYPLSPSSPGVTSFGQTVAAVSPPQEVFPAQANSWVLERDFSLAQGFGLQYASALVLYTGTPTAPTHAGLLDELIAGTLDAFPGDQRASEAVFLTPLFGASDGVVTAAASDGVAMGSRAISGGASGFLNGTSDSRLSRTLALTPGHTYTFAWTHKVMVRQGNLLGADVAPYAPSYRVVLRDPTTHAILGAPLYESSSSVAQEPSSATRAGLPASVVLSFELRSAAEGLAELDDVTLEDVSDPVNPVPVALANGDFEAGLAGWDANGGAESQNVRSGARDVGTPGSALRVTRTFYAPPASPWARLVDVFHNPGTADVTTTAIYVTTLGIGPTATPHVAVTQNGAAIVAWDPGTGSRDVGFVSGSGEALVVDGDPFAFVTHPLTVPAGGRVALVHFVVQPGEASGGAAVTDVPAGTDATCAAVAAGFPGDDAYRIDLEPGVLAKVANF